MLSRSLRLGEKKKKSERGGITGGGKGISERTQTIGQVWNKEGGGEKLKKLEGWGVRTARGRFLYPLGRAVVITDGRIGTPYLTRES